MDSRSRVVHRGTLSPRQVAEGLKLSERTFRSRDGFQPFFGLECLERRIELPRLVVGNTELEVREIRDDLHPVAAYPGFPESPFLSMASLICSIAGLVHFSASRAFSASS